MILSDSHISISSSTDINAICKPFFEVTGIALFSYVRVFKTGQLISLTTNPTFQRHYYSKEFYKQPNAISTCINSGNHLLASNLHLSDMLSDARSIFDLDNLFEMVINCGSFYEVLRFGGKVNNNKVLDIYFNNQDVLTAFKFYFLEKSKNIIKTAQEPNKLIDLSKFISDEKINVNYDLTTLNFLKDSTTRYYVGEHKDQYFTKRELEVLLYLIKGRTAVEISRVLKISEATVRSYTSEMIGKIGVQNKAELLHKATGLGFSKLIK